MPWLLLGVGFAAHLHPAWRFHCVNLHTQFIGEVMNVKIDDAIQEKGNQPIIEQIKPLIFAPDSRNYYGIGEQVAQAFSIGKEIK